MTMDDGISSHIEKLGHPLEPVRIRALRTIVAKLELDLTTVEKLVDQPNLIYHLVNWLKSEDSLCTDELTGLIQRLAKNKDAAKLFWRYDPEFVILSRTFGHCGEEFVQNLRKLIDLEKAQPLIQNQIDDDVFDSRSSSKSGQNSINSNATSSDSSMKCEGTGNIHFTKKKMKKKKCCFHDAVTSSELSSLPWDESRLSSSDLISSNGQSPELVAMPSNAIRSIESADGLHETSVDGKKWPQIRWPSPSLAESDIKVLKTVGTSLNDRDQCREAVTFFSTVVLQDFPPQIFLNDTSILQSLLRLAEDRTHHQDVVIRCLGELTSSLLRFYHFHLDTRLCPSSLSVDVDRCKEGEPSKIKPRVLYDSVLRNISLGISLGDYCGLILEKVGPHIPGLLQLLSYCVADVDEFWKVEDSHCLILKQGIKLSFSQFCSELMKDKALDPFRRLQAHVGMFSLLRSALPISSAKHLLPRENQLIMYNSLLDPVLQILFPGVQKLFCSYVESFEIKNGIPLNEYFIMVESLEAGAEFINTSDWSSLDACLACFSKGVPALELHEQVEVIPKFVDFIVQQKTVLPKHIHAIQNVCLKLFASLDLNMKRAMYESAERAVSSFLGPQKSSKNNVPFPELFFVVNRRALTEILSFGVTSIDSKIKESSSNILILLLKCQTLVTVSAWREIVCILRAIFPLLHSLAETRTDFGRAVVSSLDPDVSKEMLLSDLDILKGNVRLMMSKDEQAKEEGTARVIYLVDIQSHVGRHRTFNLSLEAADGHTRTPASYEERSLLRVLEVIKIGSGDVSMMKSAVAQLSLMTEDTSLHILFLDYEGLELSLDFLKNSVEHLNSDSQHFFMHSVVILKNIAEFSMQVRNDLSNDLYFLSTLLKGVFLYGDDWRILRDASQLLTLVVYTDVIQSKDGKLCFPFVIMQRVKLPFRVAYYGDVSEHQQPSLKGKLLTIPRVQKALGLCWAAASCKNGVNELVESQGLIPKTPQLLPVSAQDLASLAACSLDYNLKLHLNNLSTAYSHSSAGDAIENLFRYLNVAIEVGDCPKLPSLPWETSFKRYLTTLPASVMDQVLLTQILKFLNSLLAALPDQRLWVSSIVKDPAFTFNSLLSQLLVADMDETAKELSFEILTLVEICLDDGSNDGWETVVSYLMQCLSQSHSQQFYSIAVMDKLLKCLLKVTEKKMKIKTKSLWKLLNAFHCPTPDTYMGLTITRLTLLCLSNILPLHPKPAEIVKSASEIKWLWEMLESRDVVVKSASLELLRSLCCDPLTTEQLIAQSTTLWSSSLRILLDHNELNLAREQAVNLCNVIASNSSNKSYVKQCVDAELFKCIALIAARVEFPSNSPTLWFKSVAEEDIKNNTDSKHLRTSAALLKSCCDFCLNLVAKDRDVISAVCDQGLMAQLFRQVSQWQSAKALSSQGKIDLYASICRLLVQFASSPKSSASECVPVMVWLLQESTYSDNVNKSELITQSVMLLSAIVSSHKGIKVIFTKEAIETICSSISSSNGDLFNAFATALPPLCAFLSPAACVTIIKGFEKKYDPALRTLLAAILSSSTAATLAAVECGLLVAIIQNLRDTNINLATTPLDLPRSKKSNATLKSLSMDFALVTNFLAGCMEAKEQCAALGLADALHKLWNWCVLDQDLLCSLLQVLVTFTAESLSAAATLVMTSNMIGVNQRKTPSPNSLLHAAVNLLSKDSYDSEVKMKILELTTHACQALESRTVLFKSNIISEFLKFSRLKRCQNTDELEVPWLKFLVVFTYYNEGQPLLKNEEFFSQLMLYMSTGRSCVKPLVMAVFRNLTFSQNSKQKLVVCDRWLKLLAKRALELIGAGDELRDLALIVWYLVANSQRGKAAVRMFNLDTRIRNAAATLPHGHQTLGIVDDIMTILKPPSNEDIT